MRFQMQAKTGIRTRLEVSKWLIALILVASVPALGWPESIVGSGSDSPMRPPREQAAAQVTNPETFYRDEVDEGLQDACLTCHLEGGVARRSGARLALSGDAGTNHEAFTEFLALDDTDGARILAKVTGQYGHGGGAVLTPSSLTYVALQDYLTMLGALTEGPQGEDAFWEGTAAEPRDITLRRAALLLAGQIPSAASLSKASESEAGLREQIMAAMSGPGFRDFVIRGANDRLLVDGLLNGLNFDIDTQRRYPALAELTGDVARGATRGV